MIELMVAITLSALLILGLVQVFSASRSSYLTAQGMARTQENGRFAIDYLQRDARLAGHMGCVNDQSHFLSSRPTVGELFLSNRDDYSTVPAVTNGAALRFDYSIQGYEAVGSAPGQALSVLTVPAIGAATDWAPALPAILQIPASSPRPVKGSDILFLRMLSPESTVLKSFSPIAGTSDVTLQVDGNEWPDLKQNSVTPGLFALSDCRMTTLFQASAITEPGGKNDVTVSVLTGSGKSSINQSGFTAYDAFDPALAQTRLYRADIIAYYVGFNTTTQSPSLYRMSFTSAINGAQIARNFEEVVPGVENMQLLYGQDSSVGSSTVERPTGFINTQVTAQDIKPNNTSRDGWQRVGSIKVGLMVRSPDPAVAQLRDAMPYVLGTQVTYADDKRYRTVYETNIAVRNRLFGN